MWCDADRLNSLFIIQKQKEKKTTAIILYACLSTLVVHVLPTNWLIEIWIEMILIEMRWTFSWTLHELIHRTNQQFTEYTRQIQRERSTMFTAQTYALY